MIRVWKKVGFLWLGCPAFSCFFYSCNVYPSQNGWISVVNQATQVESGGQRNIVRHGLIHCREAIFFEHCRACVVRQCFSTFDVLSCRSVCSTRSVLFDDDTYVLWNSVQNIMNPSCVRRIYKERDRVLLPHPPPFFAGTPLRSRKYNL